MRWRAVRAPKLHLDRVLGAGNPPPTSRDSYRPHFHFSGVECRIGACFRGDMADSGSKIGLSRSFHLPSKVRDGLMQVDGGGLFLGLGVIFSGSGDSSLLRAWVARFIFQNSVPKVGVPV